MSYKIVRITEVHPASALEKVLDQNPALKRMRHDELKSALFQYQLGYSDSFSDAMKRLGNEAEEIVSNSEILLRKWAEENHVVSSEANWRAEILLAQLSKIRPDVVLLMGTNTNPEVEGQKLAEYIKKHLPSIRLILLFSGFPSKISRLRGADIVLTGLPFMQDQYRKFGVNSILWYHSFDERLLLTQSDRQDDEHPLNIQFSFAGSTRAPETRYWYLRHLVESTPIELWPYEIRDVHKRLQGLPKTVTIWEKWYRALGIQEAKAAGGALVKRALGRRVPLNDKPMTFTRVEKPLPGETLAEMYPERCNSPVYGADYYDVLRRSRLSFNKHTDFTRNSVGNIRMFEVPGMGSCLLTDTGANIKDLFEPDSEVVVYSRVEEAVEKVAYLLENENVLGRIARAGHARVLGSHTIFHRCELIDEVIRGSI